MSHRISVSNIESMALIFFRFDSSRMVNAVAHISDSCDIGGYILAPLFRTGL